MTPDPAPQAWNEPFEATVRVRYEETDRMGIVYHGKYFEYFEIGRTEWLRARGVAYRDLEAEGFGLVVSEAAARYRAPARYDDLLTVRTTLAAVTRVTLDFRYEVLRGAEALAEGTTRLVAVDANGRPRRFPPALAALLPRAAASSRGD